MSDDLDLDVNRATDLLLRFLAIEGVTGQERAIAQEVSKALLEGGVSPQQILYDKAHQDIPLPTQTGNLIITLPGTIAGPRLMFMTHLDTVPLCAGAVPVREKNRIVAKGPTALGGDNRTGVAVLVTLATTLLKKKLPHPPLTLLFTVREESGLYGARYLDPERLSGPIMCFNVDGGSASQFCIGAVGAERWEVEISGRASHAGVHPEQGISSTMVAALALADIKNSGWFGKIVKGEKTGTSNIGSFGGKDDKAAGEATNVVTDYVHIRGEARSHDSKFVKTIVAAYKEAFTRAAASMPNDKGKTAKIKFSTRLDYHPFRLKDNAPVVVRAEEAARSIGLTPTLRIGNGGLDANWLVRHKIPTVTFGAGQNDIHTVDEWVDLPEFYRGCRMALAIATQ